MNIPRSESFQPSQTWSKLPLRSRLRQRLQKLRLKFARRPDELRDVHAGYWGNVAPDEYYDRVAQRFEEWFTGPHAGFVSDVVALADSHSFDRLIEIGCGDGRALAELARRMPEMPSLIGLDINGQIISRNKSAYRDQSRMSFIQGDLTQIAPLCSARNTLYFVYGGVLEYFTQPELEAILAALSLKGCAIALVEPIDKGHDFTATPGSYPFGDESSFSHNHVALLEQSGWQILKQEESSFSNIRWQMVIAQAVGTTKH